MSISSPLAPFDAFSRFSDWFIAAHATQHFPLRWVNHRRVASPLDRRLRDISRSTVSLFAMIKSKLFCLMTKSCRHKQRSDRFDVCENGVSHSSKIIDSLMSSNVRFPPIFGAHQTMNNFPPIHLLFFRGPIGIGERRVWGWLDGHTHHLLVHYINLSFHSVVVGFYLQHWVEIR